MESLNWFKLLMLFGVLQGGLLIAIVNRIPNRHKSANKILSIFIVLIIINSSWEIWKVPDKVTVMDGVRNIFFFLYGPFFYFYVRSLLTKFVVGQQKWFIHSIPALTYTVLLIFMGTDPEFWYSYWMFTTVFVLIHGMSYLIKSYLLIRKHQNKILNFYPHLKFLQAITTVAGICILTALGALLVFISDLSYYVTLFNHYISGVIGSLVIYSLAYFAVRSPEVFKYYPVEEEQETQEDHKSSIPASLPAIAKESFAVEKVCLDDEELQLWKSKLEEIMIISKPFLNPALTLDDLAEAMQTDKLLTSRVIREGFQVHFYDFVNSYRVEHFVELSKNKKYQHYTTLALAYEAGFNAKSTFHKVFKKLKKTTPTAYLKGLLLESE